MPLMRSPDGSETVEVPDDMVEHYQSLGATLDTPAAPPEFRKGFPITRFPGQSSDQAEADPLLDPTALIPTGSFGGAVRAGASLPRALPMIGSALSRITGIQGAKMAAPELGSMGARVAEAAASPAGRFALGELPVVGRLIRAAEAMKGTFGKAAGSAESRVAQKVEGKVVGRIGRAKPRRPPKGKPKAPKGSAESRTMSAEEQATARAKGRQQVTGEGKDFRRLGSGRAREAPSQAMRGSSGPQLERRALARTKAVERMMPEPDVSGGADDLTRMLEQSLEIEARMAQEGLSEVEKAIVRAAVRGQ